MTRALSLASSAILACAASPALASGPDLGRCPPSEHTADSEVQRSAPLPIPRELRGVVKADAYRMAVLTLSGATFCTDTGMTDSIADMELSPDGRFLSYEWIGYEVYGHHLIDRTGQGALHEIGAKPVYSPSRRQFAAVDQTESEFGSLSGLAIWSIGPAAVRQIAALAEIPRMNDWRIDGWSGEDCIALSAIPFERTPDDPKQWGNTRRNRFAASFRSGRWTIKPAKGCPAK